MGWLTSLEILLLLLLAALSLTVLVLGWLRSSLHIWSPCTLFAALILYYIVVGPLIFVIQGRTDFLGVDYRPLFWLGWLASLIAFVSYLLGYLMPFRARRPVAAREDPVRVTKIAVLLLVTAASALVTWASASGRLGTFLNPLAATPASAMIEDQSPSVFINYLLQTSNLVIPALVLLLALWMKRRKGTVLAVFTIALTLALMFFINTGFRFRIAWTAIGLVSAFYLLRRVRPNVIVLAVGVVAFLLSMGFIGVTRNYYSGLSLERAADLKSTDLFESGFSDAGIFFSVGAVVDAVPSRLPHTYLDPLVITAAFPVPRLLWPDKPRSRTLEVLASTFASQGAFEAGQSVPYFGEWYIAFGWPGIILSSVVFGAVSRRMWAWYLRRRHEQLPTVAYCTFLGFSFVAFSRGYLPQITMTFCFTVLPLFWLVRLSRRGQHPPEGELPADVSARVSRVSGRGTGSTVAKCE